MMPPFVFDNLDSYILVSIYQSILEKRPIPTTWVLAKGFFNLVNTRELSDKSNSINVRLKKLEKYGLINIKRRADGRMEELRLDESRIILKRMKFPDNKIHDALGVKDNMNRWMIMQV